MSSASAIYHQAIKSLAAEAVGHGSLAAPDARVFLDNPLCGDCVEIEVALDAGAILELAHKVRGCLLCRAAASVIGKHARGARLDGIERAHAGLGALLKTGAPPPPGWDELAVFAPVHGHASRYRCVELPFEALIAALRAPPA